MNILDENILADQRQILLNWHIPFRQIGYEVARKGIKDENIIPFLLTLRQATFFTCDGDFYKPNFCHPRYCLVHLDVDESDAAVYVRRVLRYHEFSTHAKRMGAVIRASHSGMTVRRLHARPEVRYAWK
jgi:hypothetical protein